MLTHLPLFMTTLLLPLPAFTGKKVVAFDAGYVFWLAATDSGEVYTCNSQVGMLCRLLETTMSLDTNFAALTDLQLRW